MSLGKKYRNPYIRKETIDIDNIQLFPKLTKTFITEPQNENIQTNKVFSDLFSNDFEIPEMKTDKIHTLTYTGENSIIKTMHHDNKYKHEIHKHSRLEENEINYQALEDMIDRWELYKLKFIEQYGEDEYDYYYCFPESNVDTFTDENEYGTDSEDSEKGSEMNDSDYY